MGFSAESANVVQMLASLAVFAYHAICVPKDGDVNLRALLLTSGTLLVSPHSYSYDMPAITAAMLWVMSAVPTTPLRHLDFWRGVGLAGWTLLSALFPYWAVGFDF